MTIGQICWLEAITSGQINKAKKVATLMEENIIFYLRQKQYYTWVQMSISLVIFFS